MPQITTFSNIKPLDNKPLVTGFYFLDNNLGGGLPIGGAYFLAGSPGSGKSTLCTQIIGNLANQNKKTLYIAGEEDPSRQIARFERLGVQPGDNLIFFTDRFCYVEDIIDYIENNPIDLLIIDSIQKLKSKERTGERISTKLAILKIYSYLQRNPSFALLGIMQCTKEGKPEGFNSSLHEFDGVIHIEHMEGKPERTFYYSKNRFGETGARSITFLTEGGFLDHKPATDNPYPVATTHKEYKQNNDNRDLPEVKHGQNMLLWLFLLPFKIAFILVSFFFVVFASVIFFYKPNGNTKNGIGQVLGSISKL